MSSPRDLAPFLEFLKKLRPATDKQKQGNVDGDTLEWKHDHEIKSKDSAPLPIKRLRIKLVESWGNNKAIIDVSYQDGQEETLYVPSELMYEMYKIQRTINLNLREWNFLNRMFESKIDWSRREFEYTEKTLANYKAIHQAMLEEFKAVMKSLSSDPDVSINIVDAGCGDACQLLEGAFAIAQNNFKKVKALGFDYEQINVDSCNDAKKHDLVKRSKDIKFVQGDTNNIEDMFKSSEHLFHDPHAVNCEFSSGSMTRMTLQNAFEAIKILKSNWRGPTHFLFAGGETEFLFNERILEKIGYRIKVYKKICDHKGERLKVPVIVCERISEEEKLKYIKDRLYKKTPDLLDLTLSPCPQTLIRKIGEQDPDAAKKVTTIDLSFSDLADCKKLSEDLKAYTGLKKIVCTTNDPNVIKGLIQFAPSGVALEIRYTKNEVLLSASKKYLQRAEDSEVLETKEDICNSYNDFINLMMQKYAESPGVVREKLLQCYDLITDLFIKNPKIFNVDTKIDTVLSVLQFVAEADKKTELSRFITGLKSKTEMDVPNIISILVRANNPDALRLFLKASGASLAEICKSNPMIFKDAVEHNAKDIFQVFHENKVDLTMLIPSPSPDDSDQTLMTAAINAKKFELIPVLAKFCPALVDMPNSKGWAPVMSAIKYGDRNSFISQKALCALLELKPNLQVLDPDINRTVAHEADTVDKIIALQNAGCEFIKDIKVNLDYNNRTPFQALLSNLSEDYRWDSDIGFQNKLKQWKCVLQMLIGDTSINVDNPQIRYDGKLQPLKIRLAELASKIYSLIEPDLKLQELFEAVAKKYHCENLIKKAHIKRT